MITRWIRRSRQAWRPLAIGAGSLLDLSGQGTLREWGRAHGWADLSDFGRVPHAVLREYERVNPS